MVVQKKDGKRLFTLLDKIKKRVHAGDGMHSQSSAMLRLRGTLAGFHRGERILEEDPKTHDHGISQKAEKKNCYDFLMVMQILHR